MDTLTTPTRTTPVTPSSRMPGWDTYSPKIMGPKYPEHNRNAPIIGPEDWPGLIVGIIMALGPLSAYAAGFGL